MARGKKNADNTIILMGLFLLAGYVIYKSLLQAIFWIKENSNVVLGSLILIAAVIFLLKYFKHKTQSDQAEKEKQLELEAKKLKEILANKRLRAVDAFVESQDYKLIEGYVTKNPFEINSKHNSEFLKMVEVISFDWDLDIESILEITRLEHSRQKKISFKTNLKKHNPILYNEYLDAALEQYGDNVTDYLDLLHQLLIEENIIIPQTPPSQILADAQNIRRVKLKEGLKKQLISERSEVDIYTIDQMSPYQFETYIANLYKNNGYRVETTKITGDQGADVVLEKFGERFVIQVKLYSSPVGNKAVQEVCAAIKHYNAHQGIVITNNYFTPSARELSISNQITLIDRNQLKAMI
ncbi:restriction endonuclease [Dyadobacter sp. CY356]|uniref:restriction endonuclease n=1 Tax=Dyadobacter sp. CY356 TaxID=2906442 RepID=UPI001F1DDA1B|nr:restriction endonuclease [Dyadobacter sp. CY356]MCF0056623.1 restriction endonuclease [Dyadobacter sp. CY356]